MTSLAVRPMSWMLRLTMLPLSSLVFQHKLKWTTCNNVYWGPYVYYVDVQLVPLRVIHRRKPLDMLYIYIYILYLYSYVYICVYIYTLFCYIHKIIMCVCMLHAC